MRKITLVLSGIFCGIIFIAQPAFAQPVLTNANILPQIGESFRVNKIKILPSGISGANVTWDFSTVSWTGIATVQYVAPSSTPYAASFPSATIVYSQSGSYDFYNASSSSFSRLGAVALGTTVPYSNPEMVLSFPFTYNTTFTDSFVATVNTMQRKGNVTVIGDGYGTLILPYRTFQNVLRVKLTENYADYLQGTLKYQYNSTIYIWYLPGTHYPLLSFTSLTTGTGSLEYGGYLDSLSIGINDNFSAINMFNLFPNPAVTEYTNITYSLKNVSDVKLTVTNLLGEKIKEDIFSRQSAGTYNYRIETATLSKGVYIVSIESEMQSAKSKLIVP